MKSYDLVIVGVGAMGSSALYHASRRGLKVLGIERFGEVPHEQGSHHGSTRIIRKAYFEHPGYVPLLLRAYELWEQLEREVDEKLIVKCGGLMIGSPTSEVVTGAILAAQRHELTYEVLSKQDVQRRYPFFALDDTQQAVFEPDAGYLFSELAVKAHVQQAIKAGAELKLGCQVAGWSKSGDGVEIQISGETVYADKLLLTVGAWAPNFIDKSRFQVERQVLHWFEPEEASTAGLPIYIVEEQDGSTFYGFPNIPLQGLKVAIHHGGENCTADTVDRVVHPADIKRMRFALSRRIPSLAASRLIKTSACMYTNTPDFHFIVGPHPEEENVILGLGYSGHGFKFSSVMGELLVKMALGENTIQVPEIFAPDRFAQAR
ncbi:N-methyl-L-tryptophan oxidase [Alicyclobacillus ferrooxydans]|uniref:FAD dependent oxidoreductase domain-containing protein n=1 Tax=Alicyclobacillus ferrooxydans TaxID=471514 RepID=A0A0P9GQK7_9BACL|nr:N-methyl-L-tryptophan oxidase [Alicyclobacillus ferrooxydans]KPV43112.1 hypothetical protein AN477_14380 [Alicyclobacillus ferrooxydans]